MQADGYKKTLQLYGQTDLLDLSENLLLHTSHAFAHENDLNFLLKTKNERLFLFEKKKYHLDQSIQDSAVLK